MTLPTDIADWPPWAKESYGERLAIMEADDVTDAETKAEACVRKEAACE